MTAENELYSYETIGVCSTLSYKGMEAKYEETGGEYMGVGVADRWEMDYLWDEQPEKGE